MKTLLSLCLYLALLDSVASLTCYSCMNMEKMCEHPDTEKCATDQMSCVSVVAEGSLGPFSMSMSIMTCVESRICRPGYYSASISEKMHSQTNVSCCNTDKCNNMTITVPIAEQRAHNGLTCPSCYSLHHDHCQARDTVKCVHKEDRCFYYSGVLHNGTQTQSVAARGCATEETCNINKGVVRAANNLLNITHAECCPASHEF